MIVQRLSLDFHRLSSSISNVAIELDSHRLDKPIKDLDVITAFSSLLRDYAIEIDTNPEVALLSNTVLFFRLVENDLPNGYDGNFKEVAAIAHRRASQLERYDSLSKEDLTDLISFCNNASKEARDYRLEYR